MSPDPVVFAWANPQTMGGIARSRLSETAKTMARFHVFKPWIDGFIGMALSPLRRGLRDYLGPYLFSWKDIPWYHPAVRWWQSHAKRSHGPDGRGCDVSVHDDWLGADGKEAEFAYMSVVRGSGGTEARILGRRDFEDECAFWRENVGM